MCSLTDSALDPALVEKKLTISDDKTCKKCRECISSVNLRAKDTYCRDCFLLNVHHKVRSTLGKHKATRPGDKVLVAASGGTNSSSLLHILQQGIKSDHKRLLFEPLVVYIDEGALWSSNLEERRKNIANVRRILSVYEFEFHLVLLEDFNSGVKVYKCEDDVKFSEKLAIDLFENFSNLKESSSKQELLQHMIRSVLIDTAQHLNCEKIFTGENGTVLAVELLAGVAGGSGASLPNRIGFKDFRECSPINGEDSNKKISILRPMRDVYSKEVALYCAFYQLETSIQETFGTYEDSFYSIKKLTEDFLVGLQDNFPATIPTIFKTGDKLSMSEVSEEQCCLCKGPMDISTLEHNALQATLFSSVVSEKGKLGLGEKVTIKECLENDFDHVSQVENCNQNDNCCGEGDGSCQSNKAPVLSSLELSENLCYACRRTFGKITSIANIPVKLQEKVLVKSRRKQMREEISDFLL